MQIDEEEKNCWGIRFSVKEDGKEIARAFLYIARNDLHSQPFALLEDVFVEESVRGKGIGTKLVKEIIKKAKEIGAYKIIATSRYSRQKVHSFYKKLGFEDYGKEFRIDF